MAQDNKFGTVSTEHGSIPDDEPVFVLRGQDSLAVPAMRNYRELARSRGCDDAHLQSCDEAIDAMVMWQSEHGTKLPDSEDVEDGGEGGEEGGEQ